MSNLANMTTEDLTSLAKIMDEKAHFGLTKVHRAAKNGKISYQSSVSVGTTDHKLVERLHDQTGLGKVYRKTPKNEKHNVLLNWKLGSKDCRELLPKIQKDLSKKTRQAEIVLEYLTLAENTHKKNQTELDVYLKKCEDLWEECCKLNKRGV